MIDRFRHLPLVAVCAMFAACTIGQARHHPQRPSEPDRAVAATPAAIAPAPVPAATGEAATTPVPSPPPLPAAPPPPPPAPAPPTPPHPPRPAPSKPAAATVDATPRAPSPPPAAGGKHLSGHVELVAASGQRLDAAEAVGIVVYYVPTGGAPKPRPGNYSIVMRGKRFDPAVLVVPAGSTVGFPNQDEILHNVFSVSPKAAFDLGLYGEGQSAETLFDSATLVQVFCNVHHSMHADILVLSTPWFARTGASGEFKLDGLPAGSGTLYFWHPRAGSLSREVNVPGDAAINEKLLATKPVIPEHRRKDGESYRPTQP